MVCLYGLTLCRLEALLTNDDADYYSWNWLIHKLTYFVYTNFGHGVGEPGIPKYNTLDPYSIWFYHVFEQLADEFHDTTPILTLRCLKNTPEEKMAEMMYDELPLDIQLSFLDYLQLQHNQADGGGGDGGGDGGGSAGADVGLPILC